MITYIKGDYIKNNINKKLISKNIKVFVYEY
jgi:hypothetical protein